MMTSGQIAGMMQQQTQGFAGNMAYSQQISAGMPGAYGAGAPQGYSYGGGGMSNAGFANAIGDRAMAVGGGIANAAIGMGTSAGMFSVGMRGIMGGNIMGGLAGAAGIGLVGAGLKHVVGSTFQGAAEQAGVENVLGGFKMANTGTGGGKGFGRQEAMAVGDMMRKMEALPELMTSMGELTSIMDKMGQMGMMQGAQNVAEFQRKFKDNIKTLKDMAKMMGSTMEEALPMFGEIQRSGFYSTGDILKNAMSRQISGNISGLSQGQIAGNMQMGAQMSFATGGTRRTGSEHALRQVNQIAMAKQLGHISEEQIMELTGQRGAAGVQAMAGQLTQASYKMMRGAPGTVMTLALGAQEDGRYTGKMDEDLVRRMRSGEFSTSDLMKMARQKSRGRAAAMSYVARRQQMRSEMAGQLGVEGQFQMLQNVLGERGFNNPDAMRIVSQRFGLSEREADLMVNMGQNMGDIGSALRVHGRQEAKKLAQESVNKQYSWSSVKAKAKKRLSNAITKPFKDAGAEIRNAINGAIEDFMDDVTGRYSEEVTKRMQDLTQGAAMGLKGYRAELGSMLDGGVGQMFGTTMAMGQDMTTGLMGSAANWLSGSESGGAKYARMLGLTGTGKRGLQTFTEEGIIRGGRTAGGLQREGYHVLDRDRGIVSRNKLTAIKKEDAAKALQELQLLAEGGDTENVGYWKKQMGAAGQAELQADYLRMKMSADFGDKKGEALIKAQAKWLREKGSGAGVYGWGSQAGRVSAGKGARKLGDAELIMLAGGKSDVMSELGDLSTTEGLTEAGRFKLSRKLKDLEEDMAGDVFGGDRTKAEEFKAAFKGTTGRAGRRALQAFMAQGDFDTGKDIAKQYGGLFAHEKRIAEKQGGEALAMHLMARQMKGASISRSGQLFLENNAVAVAQLSDKAKLTHLLGTPKGDWSDKERQMAKDLGYADGDISEKEMNNLRMIQGSLVGLDEKERKKLMEYAKASDAQGLAVIAGRLQRQGNKAIVGLNRIDEAIAKGEFGEAGDETKAFLKDLRKQTQRMTKTTTKEGMKSAFGVGGGDSVFQDIAELATDERFMAMSENQQQAIIAAMGEQGETFRHVSGLNKKLQAAVGRGGKGTTLGQLTQQLGLGPVDKMDKDLRAEMERIIGSKEGGKKYRGEETLDKEEVKDMLKLLGAKTSSAEGTMAGAEQKTKYADPVEVGKQMNSFVDNVSKLTDVIKKLQEESKK